MVTVLDKTMMALTSLMIGRGYAAGDNGNVNVLSDNLSETWNGAHPGFYNDETLSPQDGDNQRTEFEDFWEQAGPLVGQPAKPRSATPPLSQGHDQRKRRRERKRKRKGERNRQRGREHIPGYSKYDDEYIPGRLPDITVSDLPSYNMDLLTDPIQPKELNLFRSRTNAKLFFNKVADLYKFKFKQHDLEDEHGCPTVYKIYAMKKIHTACFTCEGDNSCRQIFRNQVFELLKTDAKVEEQQWFKRSFSDGATGGGSDCYSGIADGSDSGTGQKTEDAEPQRPRDSKARRSRDRAASKARSERVNDHGIRRQSKKEESGPDSESDDGMWESN